MPDLIPAVLHQIWVGPRPLPDTARRWAEGWLHNHPGWEYRLWTDANLPELEHRAIYEETDLPAQRADILRYELLCLFGGVYADTDFESLHGLDDLIRAESYIYGDECPGRPAIGLLGATPGHPFARHCVEHIPDRWPWRGQILDETGPDFFARALADYLGDFRAVTVADPRTGREAGYRMAPGSGRDEVTVLHPWTVYPYYLHEIWVPTDHPDAYAAHHWHNTWSA